MLFILLIIVITNTVIADEAMIDENLQCLHDFDSTMVCHLTTEKTDCNSYNMSLKIPVGTYKYKVHYCTFKGEENPSVDSKCRCSIDKLYFVTGEIFTAILFSSEKLLTSKNISVTDSMKPKPPTIQDVKLTKNRNFVVEWKTNYGIIKPFHHLFAEMSYRKNGEKREELKNITSSSVEISGKDLEPNTNYSIKIRTYSDISKISPRFSDWSKEFEFTNPASPQKFFNIFIVLICIAVLIMTCVLFWWGVRLKAKWWDNIPTCSNPELFHVVSGVPKVLNPPKIILSNIYFDSSKMNTTERKTWSDTMIVDVSSEKDIEVDSSSPLDFPKTYTINQEPSKMPDISPLQMFPPNQLMIESEGSGVSSCFNNMTYSPSAPFNCLEVPPSKTSPFLMQPLHLDPSLDDVFKHLHPQTFFGSDISVSTETPLLQTDFTYHSCESASGASLTTMSAEDASLHLTTLPM